MSGHTWHRARVGDRCGSCHARQLALAPVCRLHTGRLRCAACAKQMFGEDVPAELAEAEAQLARAPKPRPVNGAQTWHPLQPFVKRLRQRLFAKPALDVKARAAGEKP